MADDKIKYSDIIEPDDSIERLIRQLEELNATFGQAMSGIKGGAAGLSKSMKAASGATAEGRKELDLAAVAADRLNRAYNELEIAMSDAGREIAQVKAATSDTNKASVAQMRWLDAMVGSYDKLKLELKEATALFKSLSAAERASEGMGKALIDEILRLKNEVKALDDQLKPHIQRLTAVEQAEQKLAFLTSEQGQRYLELRKRIHEVTAARKEQKAVVTPLAKAHQQLKYAQSEEYLTLQKLNIQTQEAARAAKLQAQKALAADGSYAKLAAQYELNKIKLNAMTGEMRASKAVQDGLEKETFELYQQMRRLQEATGKHTLSVGNYGKAWNGLAFSLQQTVRELPAAAVGFNTFILGISNNIPYVIDEIIKLKAANEAAKKSGGEVVPIGKSIVKSLLSWQTALMVGITILSMHGDKVLDWAARLVGAKAKVMSLTKAIKNINEELESTNASYGENVVKLKHLQDEWKKLKTTAEKTKWIKDNKPEFSSLYIEIDNINDAEKTFVTQTDEVAEGFKARAKAAAANKLAAEKYEEAMRLELKAANLQKEWDETNTATFSGAFKRIGQMSSALFAGESPKEIKARAEALKEEGDQYFRLAEGYDKASTKGGGRGRQKRDMTDYIAQMNISTLKKRETLRTALEQEEYQKRITAIEKRYAVENAELQKTYDKNERILRNEEGLYKDLTAEQVRVMLEAQERIRESLAENERLMLEEKRQALLDQLILEEKVLQEGLKLKLDTIKKGSDAELETRRKILESQRQQALAADQKLPPSQRQGADAINASFDVQDKLLQGEFFMSWFDMYQDMERAQFESVIRTGREIKVKALEQERDRWQAQVDLAKAGMLDWSDEQIKAAEATTEKLSREIKKQSNFFTKVAQDGLGTTLLNALGIKDEDAVQGFIDSASVIIDQINAIMDAEIKAKEKAVELAQERVDAAQSAVDAEIEARKNGYANSVAVAKAELEMEKRNQRQKEKELRRAQQAQEAINSVTQASSLVTATANLLAGWSSIPIIGQALAIAAISTMWGTFAMAKIRASQLTSKYGEGGIEFLEGGSHAMGNDIDLGVSNSKNRRMKAEGGEALAIINKRNSRKYRKVLPDVIDSFNRGTFEQKYLNAFDTGGQPIFVTNQSNNIDLSRIEADIRAIKDRNNTQIYTLPDGSVIMQKKNVKRIIRQ